MHTKFIRDFNYSYENIFHQKILIWIKLLHHYISFYFIFFFLTKFLSHFNLSNFVVLKRNQFQGHSTRRSIRNLIKIANKLDHRLKSKKRHKNEITENDVREEGAIISVELCRKLVKNDRIVNLGSYC